MTSSNDLEAALSTTFGDLRRDELLSRYTTLRVGGPARYFITANQTSEIVEAVGLCRAHGMPYFVLGGGSNLIFSDSGFPGLVIQNRSQQWRILEAREYPNQALRRTPKRFETIGEEYYTTEGMNYTDENEPAVVVRVDSGARIGPLMNALFREGVTGLQWFAGIPATVGGAIYMNMHGGPQFFGDLVTSALLLRDGESLRVANDYFEFDYDYSVLHHTRAIVLQADLLLRRGLVERAREIARTWAARKALQPQISAGCIFRNLTREEQGRLNLPTSSIGYLVDKVLNLKGERRGDAIISQSHAAFIENLGKATAAEVVELIELVRERASTQLGLDLILEVELVGFEKRKE